MGYGGYLVKFGDYTIPNNLIKQDTFSSYVNMQDKDPWTDENGYEHRDAVELKALKVEFETKAMLTEKQFDDFWKNIEKNMKVEHIMVEANYSMDLVDRNEPNYEHRLRGHMSLYTALKFIQKNDNPALRNVVLIHLSDTSGDPALFLQRTKKTIKYGANVYVAEKGLEVDMNLCPF